MGDRKMRQLFVLIFYSTSIQKDMTRIVRLKSSTLPALLASIVAAAMKRTYVGLPACDWKICASYMCEVIHDDLLYE